MPTATLPHNGRDARSWRTARKSTLRGGRPRSYEAPSRRADTSRSEETPVAATSTTDVRPARAGDQRASRLPGPASAEDLVGDEWAEWYRLTPAERWLESKKLWQIWLTWGRPLDPEPDTIRRLVEAALVFQRRRGADAGSSPDSAFRELRTRRVAGRGRARSRRARAANGPTATAPPARGRRARRGRRTSSEGRGDPGTGSGSAILAAVAPRARAPAPPACSAKTGGAAAARAFQERRLRR